MSLLRLLLRRVVLGVVLLFVVSALSFLLISITPGDPAREILGVQASQDTYLQFRHQMGLDLPLQQQYLRWLNNVLHGDLGTSLFTGESVSSILNQRLPTTTSLIVGAMLVTVVVGAGLGILSALQGRRAGRVVDTISLVGFAFPSFWVGTVLIVVFAVKLGWLPATGYVAFRDSPLDWAKSLVLPVGALSLAGIAAVAKQTRESMLDVLGAEHIRMGWANGLSPASIYLRHAFRNAGTRVVTILGLQAVGLLGGTVAAETVFALPGLGSAAVMAAFQHDLPLVQGIVVYFTVIVVLINIAVDLAYSLLDPRVALR